ncbi:MAG: ATP-binding protein [Leptolyngbyaceae cyanobacterium bins.349]|nr:ATP-binding protein [Leptolyngbyaceae cyanobacterium bins.349]
MSIPLLTVEIRYEQDVVLARQRSRQLTERLGFDTREQAWVATAVSEIARNTFQYGGGGRVEFGLEESPPQLVVTVRDQGRGIANLQDILAGRYTSPTGMGLGITGARRLMDAFEIHSLANQGTTVVMGKFLPRRTAPPLARDLRQLADEMAERSPQNPYEEIQQQNQELLRTLEELRKREDELSQLNRELEDTNRGVVALYAELDEKAESLQRANEIKTRFLSNMSHEFRTPVNSILSLTGLLLERLDGDLTTEQEKQVSFIRKAAEALSDLVNDLLDLAKVEAGKVEVRASWFELSELFGTLRGMLRPLIANNPAVALVFVEPTAIPPLYNDDGKVAQILRNFISNALKFTEQGEVRVSAVLQGDRIHFNVADTGIGIAPQDQERIFEDFVQLDSHRQRQVKGTGLGLPLSRRLAELLGGSVSVRSELGQGTTFIAVLPRIYGTPPAADDTSPVGGSGRAAKVQAPSTTADRSPPLASASAALPAAPQQPKLLIIDDDPVAHYLLRQALPPQVVTLLVASDGAAGLTLAQTEQPQAIVLDLVMPGMGGDEVLAQLAQHPTTRMIPVMIQTSRQLKPAELEQLRRHAIAVIPKGESHRSDLLNVLTQAGFDLVGGPPSHA